MTVAKTGAVRAMNALSAPAEIVLRDRGIETRRKQAGAVTWYNINPCPACNHEGFQCGVSESRSGDKLIHGVKCFHPHDNPWGKENIEYGEFLERLGAVTHDELRHLRERRRSNSYSGSAPSTPPAPPQPSAPSPANKDALRIRQKRLRDNDAARQWLYARGLDDAVIDNFYLGLSTPYTGRDQTKPTSDALVAPLLTRVGYPAKHFSYHAIPDVTQNPRDKSWAAHENSTYWVTPFAAQRFVIIVEGLKDGWRLWAFLRAAGLLDSYAIISATHGRNLPAEWKNPEWWAHWEHIYCAQDADEAGEKIVWNLRHVIGRSVYRLRVPSCPSHSDADKPGKDWTDWLQAGGTVEQFKSLVASAELLHDAIEEDDGQEYGRLGYAPVDIACAYHKGHLHYTTQTLVRGVELIKNPKTGQETPKVVERLETVIVRSDGEVLSARAMDAPSGTPPDEIVMRLSDGTLIEQRPKPSRYNSWSWRSIKAYTDAKQRKRPTGVRPLTALVRDAYRYLKRTVYLPYEDDYALLAAIVPVTYAQTVFQSVPQLLVVGPPDSGKSTLGTAMTRLCANASVIGQSSAAAIARHIDEARGFVVLDDLESVGKNGRDASQATELLQALKLSYNKETAIKVWVDVSKGNKVEKLNFFGVKMINNTSGVEAILGSRMLRITSGKIPEALRAEFVAGFDVELTASLPRLRDEFHTWTFENVAAIAEAYATMFPTSTDRANEISAPLKVMATFIDDQDLRAGLDRALERTSRGAVDPDSPIDILKEAAKRLLLAGYREISPTHLRLEMQTMVDAHFGKTSTTDIPEWSRTDWIGRQLRALNITDPHAEGRRMRLWGAHLRVYPFSQTFAFEIAPDGVVGPAESVPADAFCRGCGSCAYRTAGCPMMEARLEAEKTRPKH
ncbi:toprim domain-containing protein [Roseomonas sp. GCM10028921]